MSAKLTPWFNLDRDGNPTLPGWYDVRYKSRRNAHYKRRYFDGEKWRFGPEAGATLFGNEPGAKRHEHWRGLAKCPSAAKSGTGAGSES
jgi:hypothetical protein